MVFCEQEEWDDCKKSSSSFQLSKSLYLIVDGLLIVLLEKLGGCDDSDHCRADTLLWSQTEKSVQMVLVAVNDKRYHE